MGKTGFYTAVKRHKEILGGKCAWCGKPIASEGVSYGGRTYHPSCLRKKRGRPA